MNVHIPETGLLIKVARPNKWSKRKRGWYRGQAGIVQGHSPLCYAAFVPLPLEALAAIGRALCNHT
jgi:hypothetical protein